MNNWTYQGKEITSIDDVPDKTAIGFIYIITQISTGKRYIGRKMLVKPSTQKVTLKNGNKKIKKIKVQSDWLDYWSSSPKIKEWIQEAGGNQDFKREILTFCHSKGSLSYCEELSLYSMGALESNNWINDNIRAKIYRSWLKPQDVIELRKSLSLL